MRIIIYHALAFMVLLSSVSCQSEGDMVLYSAQSLQKNVVQNNTSISFTQYGILKNGLKVRLPWANNTSNTVPDEVRTDVKEEDGWRLLYSTIKILDYEHQLTDADPGVNYILMYNRYTGVLKGFYYSVTNSDNNTALWHLIFNKGSKLANFASYFALAQDHATPSITLSNVSTNGVTGGFENGWNCFMQELAYDENSMNEELSISGYTLNKSIFNFTGSYKGESKGTLISTTQGVSAAMSGVAHQFGEEAKTWIKKNVRADDSSPIQSKIITAGIRNILEGGVTSVVSNGLTSIFSSLLGVGSQTQIKNIQFSTNGEVKLSGESFFSSLRSYMAFSRNST